MGCHSLLQGGIFPTQGWNQRLLNLLHCRWVLYCGATREAPYERGPEVSTTGVLRGREEETSTEGDDVRRWRASQVMMEAEERAELL